MHRLLIGLDVGTTTICGLVLDAGTGEILSVVTRPNGARLQGAAPWEAIQDPEAILQTVRELLEGFLGTYDAEASIGIAGQMHGVLYLDSSGRPLGPLYTWQDGRGDQPDAGGVSTAARLSEELGNRVSTGMGFVTHAYNSAHGLVPDGAAAVCTISDYVAMTMAGATSPRMDPSSAASLGCFDLQRLDFRRADMERLGFEAGLFPEVTRAVPVIGAVAHGGRDVPVVAAVGDNQASFLGSVRDVRATALFNVGTGSQVSVRVDAPDQIAGLDIRPFPFGGCLAVGAALCGGTSYAMLRGFFEQTVRLFTGTEASLEYEAMNAIVRGDLTAPELEVDTRFSGTREDPSVRGSISGIGKDNFTPEHLVAGVREGIAAELLGFYACLPAARRARISALAGSGNGIRRNPALRECFERRLGMPMHMPRHGEETSFGAALIAGIATGALPDLAAAGSLVRYADD